NDVEDTVALDYIYDTDPPRIELKTTSLNFVDIPEGEETVRGVTFEVITCQPLTFDITAGPGSDFGTPFGTSETVDPGDGAVRGEAILWISYQGTTATDTASGSVTVTCMQTGESWTLAISANTVERPTVGVALVLDKSGSMNDDIGDGTTRNELLVYAASIFANVIQENNGIGIAAFDHDAVKVMDIKVAGPPGAIFGTGRSDALGFIMAHTPNPAGYTSIGDGVEVGNNLLTATSSSYDEMAMLVFTDGKENRSKYIADVSSLIGDKVFAIGLGTASDLNAAALAELCNNSGGELLLTDTIDPFDDYYKLAKYYLQILAGITNVDIVTDPEDWIAPGETHRIDFVLNETDISHDVVLLGPPGNVVRMVLETPNGDVVDPFFASTALGVTYVPGDTFSYYRVTLPVVTAGGLAAKEGTWTAVLTVDKREFARWLNSLDNFPEQLARARTHGVRYNLSVYALSNLRLRGTLSQDSYEPGANLALHCTLTEYGLPLAGRATVTADLTRPDNTVVTLSLPEVGPGVFEAQTVANLSGVYTARAIAEGKTARGRDFVREHTFTGAVWKGGDNPFPTTGDDPREQDRCLCALLQCLLSPAVLDERFEKKLEVEGINLAEIRRCLGMWCDCRLGPNGPDESSSSAGRNNIASLTHALNAQPQLAAALNTILTRLLGDSAKVG
ncbi:MAG: VWA domain-containing protein, partial [Anaerolineae bacterium]|nr:VWA domain-containing protein [Anaerolineae bacterium]